MRGRKAGKCHLPGAGWKAAFKSSELSDAASALQPGDGITFRIVLKNEYSGGTDWYMANEVLSSLEDSQGVAQGGRVHLYFDLPQWGGGGGHAL